MRIAELLEARDYHDIRDPADRWLAKYTYENMDKWPGKEIIQDLLSRYPAKAGTIYRGINFYTKDEHDRFVAEFGGQETANIEFGGVTSWTRSEAGSEQFAMTQPTYFLNREVMVAHGEMTKNRERLAGYRGLILTMELDDGAGIDVDASGLGHESEIVMPPGIHRITIHRVIKKYADHISDGDTTIDQVIQSTTKDDLRKSGRHGEATFFDYVMHHHHDALTDDSRAHLFKLFAPTKGDPVFNHSSKPWYSFGDTDAGKIDFHYWIPSLRLMDLYQRGILKDPRHRSYVERLASSIIKQALPVIKDNVVKAHRLDLAPLRLVAGIAGRETDLNRTLRDTIGAEYHRLQDAGREINKIRDPRQQERALRKHAEEMELLLKKIA